MESKTVQDVEPPHGSHTVTDAAGQQSAPAYPPLTPQQLVAVNQYLKSCEEHHIGENLLKRPTITLEAAASFFGMSVSSLKSLLDPEVFQEGATNAQDGNASDEVVPITQEGVLSMEHFTDVVVPAFIFRIKQIVNTFEGRLGTSVVKPNQQRRVSTRSIAEEGIEKLASRVRELLPELPKCDVVLKDVGFRVTARVPRNQKHDTVGSQFMACRNWCAPKRTVTVLDKVSMRFRAGETTLLLGPPGSGVTSLMRRIHGSLRGHGKGKEMSGSVHYCFKGADLSEENAVIPRIVSYVEQEDFHLPTLTVRETVEFAHACYSAPEKYVAQHYGEEIVHLSKHRVSALLKTLGLEGCADVRVGNETIRGVSGGQRHRLTLAEMSVGNHRVLLLDQISTGLDTAVTVDICKSITALAKVMNFTVVMSLLQPPPEVVSMFDNLAVLSHGHLLYHGPTHLTKHYFTSLGYRIPPHKDLAEFCQELGSPLASSYFTPPPAGSSRSAGSPTATGPGISQEEIELLEGDDNAPLSLQPTPAQLQAKYYSTRLFKRNMEEEPHHDAHEAPATKKRKKRLKKKSVSNGTSEGPRPATPAPASEAQGSESPAKAQALEALLQSYRRRYNLSCRRSTRLVIGREFKLLRRNRPYLRARIMQVIIMGVILGTIFWNMDIDMYQERMGVLFFLSLFIGLGQLATISDLVANRRVFYKQHDALFFRPISYVASLTVAQIPVALLETIILTSILYWFTGLNPADNGAHYFIAVGIVFLCSLSFGALFRFVAALTPSGTLALPIAGIIVMVSIIYSGFMLTEGNMVDPLIWLFWGMPIPYVIRALAVNEFRFGDYAEPIPGAVGPLASMSRGEVYLQLYDVRPEKEWIWIGALFLLGTVVVYNFCASLAFKYLHYAGISRTAAVRSAAKQSITGAEVAIPVQEAGGSEEAKAAADPSLAGARQGVTLAFRNVEYSVPQTNKRRKRGNDNRIRLLNRISAVARPGTITALMGESGAGKTTLLDVLAFRKTEGERKGDIRVNGIPATKSLFSTISGYVQQLDVLSPGLTVRETIDFAAKLKRAELSGKEREALVNRLVDLLGLHSVRNVLLGTLDAGLPLHQRKRVSIAVELVAEPKILFLDEPTSGLDSAAAEIVMKAIRQVADTGATVVCTIHQPSSGLFSYFDALLLLQAGGRTVFFGDLGMNARNLIEYFESVPGTTPFQPTMNPANWMLEVIGAGTQSHATHDFSAFYANSSLCAAATAAIDEALQPFPGGDKLLTSSTRKRASTGTQFRAVLAKFSIVYWRTPSYNFLRNIIMLLCAFTFGFSYFQLDTHTQQGMFSAVAVMFTATTFAAVISSNSVIPLISAERDVYYKERASNMYGAFPYNAAWGLVEIPYIAVSSLVFTVPFYFLIGFEADAAKFFIYYLFFALMVALAVYVGAMLVVLTPMQQVATLVMSAIVGIWNLFAGFLAPEPSIPTFWKFLYYIDPMRYVLESLVASQFHCEAANPMDCPTTTFLVQGRQVQVPQETFVEQVFNMHYDNVLRNAFVVLAFVFGVRIITTVALRFISYAKR